VRLAEPQKRRELNKKFEVHETRGSSNLRKGGSWERNMNMKREARRTSEKERAEQEI
jgi:hypothetical protein